MALASDQFSIIQNNKPIALTLRKVSIPEQVLRFSGWYFRMECVGSIIWWLSEWKGSIFFFWKVKLYNFKYLILYLFIANEKLCLITKYTLNALKTAQKWVTPPSPNCFNFTVARPQRRKSKVTQVNQRPLKPVWP